MAAAAWTTAKLSEENAELHARLREAEDTIDAMRNGEVDAIVVPVGDETKVYSLQGVDQPYRNIVETMNAAAVTLDEKGVILHSNGLLSVMTGVPLQALIGSPFHRLVAPGWRKAFFNFRKRSRKKKTREELILLTADGRPLFVQLSGNTQPLWGMERTYVVITDISELKQAEDALQRAHNQLEQRVRERTAELSAANKALSAEIAERSQAEEKLKRSSEELSNLSRRLQDVREEERKRISREIHDQVGQMLTVLEMELSFLIRKLSRKEDVRVDELESIRDRVDETITVVRRVAAESRPMLLDDLGLKAAVEWQAAEFERRTGIKVKLHLGAHEIEPEQERATAIFRILQEALTNVARHAKASGVNIGLKVVDKELLKLTVRDNGVGITEGAIRDANSTGLIGMRERMVPFNGSVKIEGSPKKGTTVAITVAVGTP